MDLGPIARRTRRKFDEALMRSYEEMKRKEKEKKNQVRSEDFVKGSMGFNDGGEKVRVGSAGKSERSMATVRSMGDSKGRNMDKSSSSEEDNVNSDDTTYKEGESKEESYISERSDSSETSGSSGSGSESGEEMEISQRSESSDDSVVEVKRKEERGRAQSSESSDDGGVEVKRKEEMGGEESESSDCPESSENLISCEGTGGRLERGEEVVSENLERKKSEKEVKGNSVQSGLRKEMYGANHLVDVKEEVEEENEEEVVSGVSRKLKKAEEEKRKSVKAALKRKKACESGISAGDLGLKPDFVASRTRSNEGSRSKRSSMEKGTIADPVCLDDDDDDDCENFTSKTGFGTDTNFPVLEIKEECESSSSTKKARFEEEEICEKDVPLGNKDSNGEDGLESSKRVSKVVGKNLDVINVLLDSISKEAPLKEEFSSSMELEDEEGPSPPSQPGVIYLPLKFPSDLYAKPDEEEEDVQADELDPLWAEFEFGLRSREMDSVKNDEVEKEDILPQEVEADQATSCRRGDHELILDEEIGLICKCCTHIEHEIRDMALEFAPIPYGKSTRRCSGMLDPLNFDDLNQDPNADSSHGSKPIGAGTVWDIIPRVKNNMFEHQREGFEFLWKNIGGSIHLDKLQEKKNFDSGSGCIISHAPGTGKTRLTIVFLQSYMEFYPKCHPLIIAPKSMLLTWEEELQKWNFDIPFHNLNKTKLSGKEDARAVNCLPKDGRTDDNSNRKVKLCSWLMSKSILGISYPLFQQLVEEQGNFRFQELSAKQKLKSEMRKILLERPGVLVLDEGHIPRNDDSLIWCALTKMKTEKRIILSGTPFQNNFTELYNTLCLVRPTFSNMNFPKSEERSVKRRGRKTSSRSRGKWESLTNLIGKSDNDYLHDSKLQKLREMIEPFVHIHRGNILQEKLPGLRNSVVILKPADLQKELLLKIKAMKNAFELDHVESMISVHPSLLLDCKVDLHADEALLEKLKSQAEAGAKTKFLIELIGLSEALNEKVLVFSQYLGPLCFIKGILESSFGWTEGNEVIRMEGKDELKKRQDFINTFNDACSKVRVLLASTKACSEGINLVGASRVVLLDVVWNPSVERQAICRAYRLGQKKFVYVYHLITSGTREEDKYCRQVEKDRISNLVFSAPSSGRDIMQKVLDDKILEAMRESKILEGMIENILDQSKESDLVNNFGLVEDRRM